MTSAGRDSAEGGWWTDQKDRTWGRAKFSNETPLGTSSGDAHGVHDQTRRPGAQVQRLVVRLGVNDEEVDEFNRENVLSIYCRVYESGMA